MLEIEAVADLAGPGRSVQVANYTTIATGDIARDPQVQALARDLGAWVEKSRDMRGLKPGMFDRSIYLPPDSPYDQMRTARHAVLEDDIVAGVADATEALAFDGGLKWESEDPDDADVFNQLSAEINLDAKIREMWRELFTVDQFTVAKLWDYRDYTVRGKTDKGNKRKRTYRVWVPTRLVLLDPRYVVPIGRGPLREDRLAWHGTPIELASYYNSVEEKIDPLMTSFFTGRYVPDDEESREFQSWGVVPDRLLTMNPDLVFRHTSTRPDYAKFPDLRLRGVFSLLDLKRQLMASDRTMLVGAANYILLIRKGSDTQPATQDEVTNLKANYQFLAKLPVIISDHRLEIDVIAPKLDFILRDAAYDTIDGRILSRVLSTFVAPGKNGSDAGVSSFTDVLASSIQNRRHMIKRTLEREIAKDIVEHPKNADLFESKPSLVFTPRTVNVGTSQAVLAALMTLRTQREISRDTILEHLGLDEATEAQRLEIEEKLYDDIFQTAIPFNGAPDAQPPPQSPGGAQPAPAKKTAAPAKTTPNGTKEAPQNSGRRGGRPPGGGSTGTSPSKTAKPKTAKGNPSTKVDD